MKLNLEELFISVNEWDCNGEPANVVDGLYQIARALQSIAVALQNLGNAQAATPLGAIENLSLQLKEGLAAVASSIEEGRNQ